MICKIGFFISVFVFLTLNNICVAQAFPIRPIVLVVPYPVGGATDRTFRALAIAAKKYFPQPIVVENKPGGSGAVAIANMLAKDPDGYSITVISPVLQRASFQNKLPFDVVKDLTPIIQVAGLQYGIVVNADSPYKTLRGLLDDARGKPGIISYMSAGIGSGGYIYMEEISAANGAIKFNHIPANGDTQAALGVLGKQVDFIAASPGGWEANVKAGNLRLLATLGEKRMKTFPETPTVKELGFQIVHLTPLGLAGPKGLQPNVVRILHEGFHKAMEDSSFISAMEEMENPIMYLGPVAYEKSWSISNVIEKDRAMKFLAK